MQGNIVQVFVEGHEVSLDQELLAEPSFEARTSRGNRYLVEIQPKSFGRLNWNVTQLESVGTDSEILVGRVSARIPIFARRPAAFRFMKSRSPLDSGSQNDLLIAVQSLTD